MNNELRKCTDASDRSGEADADAEVQIVRCEERREVEEMQGETEDSTGDRLSHVAEEAGCMLEAFSFIAVRPSA